MPYIGVSPFNGVRRKHTYTATASQTSFSGAGTEGATLTYKDSTFVDVFQNGVKLGEADYTSTSGTAIVLSQGASLNDLIEVVVYDVFSVADTVSKADGGTFDGNVTMGGTLAVTGETTLATHLNMGDSDKIKLGASGDLEVYHDGSNSFVDDTGTGSLFLRGESQVIIGNMTGEQAAVFNDDGAVTLNHDNSAKFATSSTGATVTGTVVSDGVTVNGKFLIDGSNNDLMTFRTTGDTASQVLGLQFQNNSEAVTAQIFGTGDNSSSGVFRIKGIGDVAIVGGEIGVDANAGDLVVKSGGDVHVGTGDLVFATASKGIVLGATSNTAANTLDDYEEGTWTPDIRNADNANNFTTEDGTYTKIGNRVCVTFRNDNGGTGGGGSVQIRNLPFSHDGHFSVVGLAGVNGGSLSNRQYNVTANSGTTFHLYNGGSIDSQTFTYVSGFAVYITNS